MTTSKFRPFLTVGVLSLAALLAFPGCDDEGSADLQASVDALHKDLLEAKKERDRVVAKLERMERRLEGYAQDIDRLQHQGVAGLEEMRVASGSGAESGDAAVGADVPDAAVGEITTLLETESGRAAIEKAMQSIQDKRDTERRNRMVEGMIDRFSEQADLTPQQTQQLSKIMGTRFERMREIWSAMRGGDTPREERAVMREEAMAKMEELRTSTDEEVKAVLNVDQYELFQEQGRGFGGFGGRGGDRGRGGGGIR